MEIETITTVCQECGQNFERLRKRGRPPTKCENCRNKISTRQAESIAQVDPETLYNGPEIKLLGTPEELPKGAESQCPLDSCGRIFTSDSACEFHKRYSSVQTTCVDPASIGMIPRERRNIPIWTRPNNRVFE